MTDIQSNAPPPLRVTEGGTRESQPVEAGEVPPVKRLDGEVVRQGELPFAAGTHCQLWAGRWRKRGGEEDVYEKVGSSLTSSILR